MIERRPIPLFNRAENPKAPRLDANLIAHAESVLGVALPRSYLDALAICNGGTLRRAAFPTHDVPSWHPDHVAIGSMLSIGGEHGIDSGTGSAYLIEEWDYPSPAVVISSEGHNAFLLDYRDLPAGSEPPVLYVDVEQEVEVRLAPDFASFAAALVCDWGVYLWACEAGDDASLASAVRRAWPGASEPRRSIIGGLGLELPGARGNEGGGASVRIEENRYRDGSGWRLHEYPECRWFVEASLDDRAGARLVTALAQTLPEALLVHRGWRWPSDAAD